jgi:hypothetical protein
VTLAQIHNPSYNEENNIIGNYTFWLPTKYVLLQAIIDVPVTLEASDIYLEIPTSALTVCIPDGLVTSFEN